MDLGRRRRRKRIWLPERTWESVVGWKDLITFTSIHQRPTPGTCREHWPSGLDSESDPALETDIAPFPCDEQASTQAKQGTASR